MAKSKKNKKFSLDWFINFFRKIPKNKWTTKIHQNKKGQFCAIGHLQHKVKEIRFKDAYNNPVVKKLDALFDGDPAWKINDNQYGYFGHLGKHPKDRVVTALKNVKKGISNYKG